MRKQDMLTEQQTQAGTVLPPLTLPAVDRRMLALFAGASGDHHPLHIDLDFARKSGMPDVFAHGMLGMAWLSSLLTDWAPQSSVRSVNVRFTGIIHLGHVLTCSGEVVEEFVADGERRVRVALKAINQYGDQKIGGEAVVTTRKE
jgi:acyl dehydratase